MRFTNEIRSEVEVAAAADEVWAVLSDFGRYGEWNPGFVSVTGRPEVGTRLDIRFRLRGERSIRMRPRVIVAEPGSELRWLGHLGVPGLFDGEHRFEIHEVSPGVVRFVQGERFRGLLVPFAKTLIERDTMAMFDSVNAALAARVEAVRRAA
jgi:hypothetical protein